MDKDELLERYEALGEERDFLAAKRLYEQALAEDARLLSEYGYLLACHGRQELRRAVELYERAIVLDPSYDKPHYQLISARAGLEEQELPIALYERRLTAAPSELREHRFLAQAYLHAHAYTKAHAIVEAGLALVPGDAALIAMRGDAKAGLGDAEGALADWRLALELDPEDIGALYSSAFLLEREGRLAAAADAWQAIIAWNEQRGFALQTVWPRQELERVKEALADGNS
jgi:tetratricopeptide (TPR) repeat protein